MLQLNSAYGQVDQVRGLEGRAGFEPTTPGARVQGSAAELANEPDDLPEKQEIAHERPSLRMCCNV
jgi:hypothetical protein